jgi:hypothetical protein
LDLLRQGRKVGSAPQAVALLEQLDDIRSLPGIMRTLKRALGRETET